MEFVERKNTNSIKWDWKDWKTDLFFDNEVIPMWVADMDFKAPEEVIKALQKRIDHGVFGYTYEPKSLKENIINWLEYKHSWKVKKDWILSEHGVIPSLNFSIMLFTKPKDNILIQTPVYPPFMSSVKNNNRNLLINELVLKNNKYEIDFEDLEEKLKNSKMFILCSPHNPVGRVWTKEELEKIGELCIKHDVLIVSDEIHADLVFKNSKHIPIASLSDEIAERTITLMAPSKTFNIAGFHYSFAIIKNEKLRNTFEAWIQKAGLYLQNISSLVAAEAAYKHGKDWLNEVMEYIEENYKFVKSYFEKNIPQVKVIDSDGTFLVWLDFRELNMKQDDLKRFLERKAKVGFNSGDTFGPGGEGFMRMNIATSREIVERACKQIEYAINKLN
ncbi:cystathionine beta-lyase [Marinitoga sp. 1135]|uniref:cysteine-S-conjugate beta-lyase n=1 Tax=Marinitoga piezophila (strain DSM 14283 / JCM 11233 / KA3) TaxID=443254 RepID=H2J456_MARPK|nr:MULTISPECIES: PatB family C-S lyase [Marinitoga]AEX85871.1 bifunctional PLP-dependent enzyme with beta-cystathionase and maltose regulon repressor activities [Marinitoga piezophila KA3]APT76307.1 cystathionine beta-lyase [Marinitoga sp. 1137]NUU96073.1 cystathionine beta-lyase [Marinitoga sp. 1135]NUU97984.1 cystathionine beta-lyase [Marinitoga sp. 1138]